MTKPLFFSTLVGLGFLLGAISGAIAAPPSHPMPTSQSQTSHLEPIEQPLTNKLIVTAAGLGFIGLELWWFLLRRPVARTAKVSNGIQEIAITVDGGYEPSQIVVQAGQPVRLNFTRTDPSGCLAEIRLPDFRIAQPLPVNQTTAIEFTPQQPGQYEFTCGMNMFRGTIAVEPA